MTSKPHHALSRRFVCVTGLTTAATGFAFNAFSDEAPPVGVPRAPASTPATDAKGRKVEAAGGGDLPENFRERDPETGGQKAYVVLTPEERAKGFVRPVRNSYTHLKCSQPTQMSQDIAETFATDPKFYNGGYCIHCRGMFPLSEFVWTGTEERVGS